MVGCSCASWSCPFTLSGFCSRARHTPHVTYPNRHRKNPCPRLPRLLNSVGPFDPLPPPSPTPPLISWASRSHHHPPPPLRVSHPCAWEQLLLAEREASFDAFASLSMRRDRPEIKHRHTNNKRTEWYRIQMGRWCDGCCWVATQHHHQLGCLMLFIYSDRGDRSESKLSVKRNQNLICQINSDGHVD